MNSEILPIALFRAGNVVATPHALECLTPADINRGLQRHLAGDWGEVSENDSAANNRAVVERTRILSAYNASNGTRFWIITEADRSATTILLPQDY